MISVPQPHAIGAMLLTAAMFYGFVSGRARVEIISLLTIGAIALGLYWFPLPGQSPTDGLKLAFERFGHYALITICALMVLGRGLVTTGALEPKAEPAFKRGSHASTPQRDVSSSYGSGTDMRFYRQMSAGFVRTPFSRSHPVLRSCGIDGAPIDRTTTFSGVGANVRIGQQQPSRLHELADGTR